MHKLLRMEVHLKRIESHLREALLPIIFCPIAASDQKDFADFETIEKPAGPIYQWQK